MVTREQAQAVYDQGPEAVYALMVDMDRRFEAMEAELAALRAEVSSLRGRLAKDSHNSSKPPSSDPPSRPPRLPRSLRPRGDRPSGGQPGHPGRTLQQVDRPDHTRDHAPSSCPRCGTALPPEDARDTGHRRQVFDLPPLRLEVTEHRLLETVCPCCQARCRGEFPAEVRQPAQYGPQVLALGTYLVGYHLLPLRRAHEVLVDLLGQAPSEGTLAHLLATCHDALAGVEEALRGAVTAAGVAHFDETYLRVAKRQAFLHVASTPRLTSYAYHPRRGRAAFEAIGVLPQFGGVAVHDALPSYGDPDYPARHALCNAHLLRELVGLWETERQTWTQRLAALLRSLKRAKEVALEAGQSALDPALLARYLACYDQLVERGLRHNPAPPLTGRRGRPKRGPARCLLDRLRFQKDAVLRFAMEFEVPFDNNQAERDLRMVKVQQKVSGCFRTEDGADRYARLRSYLSTLRKQGQALLPALRSVVVGNPILPALWPG